MGDSAKNSSPPQTSSPVGAARAHLPSVKALSAFEAAARHGSFARGADELCVTPSAVSHHIQQLEDFLGVQLFRRRAGSGALLTSAGRTYAREIEHAFGIIAAATHLVAPRSRSGHLVVAAGPSFAAKWLQPRLPLFLDAHPDVRIRLSTISDHDDLDTSRFDIAITYGRPHASHAKVEPLLVERLRPLCSPALAAKLDLRTMADLSRATLIHSVNALTWADYFRRIGRGDLRPSGEIWLDRSTMAIEAAVGGSGVVLESEILTEQEVRDGRLVAPVDDDTVCVETASYFLFRPAGARSRPEAAAFEKWLRAEISPAHSPSGREPQGIMREGVPPERPHRKRRTSAAVDPRSVGDSC